MNRWRAMRKAIISEVTNSICYPDTSPPVPHLDTSPQKQHAECVNKLFNNYHQRSKNGLCAEGPKPMHNLQTCSKSNWLQHQNIARIQVCSNCFYAASLGSLLLQQEARFFSWHYFDARSRLCNDLLKFAKALFLKVMQTFKLVRVL